ncbi:MAG TPA: 1-deoxy-D-xylulose-5-phosphate reductoisomerase [Bacteroidota bacterium]|nr:1-deoxy-D-xylulose-5-phosphate reductoisomerase [Bacteroidota bacterium]
MKTLCILGSTGSIGKNSLEVIANFPDRFRVGYLTANNNIDLLQQQVERFKPRAVAVLGSNAAAALKRSTNGNLRVLSGEEGLIELVTSKDVDIVISSLVGFAGLRPTIEAIKCGKIVALANKETLVVAGEIITRLVREHNARLIPIDSEHSAILQCLAGEKPEHVARIILTASGGPFLHLDKEEFHSVTVDAALRHPNWKMGNKITIDSATMMNKGLEVIEAHWLFNLPAEKIDVLVHPQSIIHSMVEFVDGSIKAQLGVPDMKIPIQYALTYPERAASDYNRVNFGQLKEMTFFQPDLQKFQCLRLAYDAMKTGGTAPAILNGANEVAVDLFLKRKISFDQIPVLIEHALEQCAVRQHPSLDEIIAADAETRAVIHSVVQKKYSSTKEVVE